MVKGRVARKEPTAWDTACHITNTVLEVAKVTFLLNTCLNDIWLDANEAQYCHLWGKCCWLD